MMRHDCGLDAHHHLWDLSVRDQPWIDGETMAPLRRNFAVDDLAPPTTEAGYTAP